MSADYNYEIAVSRSNFALTLRRGQVNLACLVWMFSPGQVIQTFLLAATSMRVAYGGDRKSVYQVHSITQSLKGESALLSIDVAERLLMDLYLRALTQVSGKIQDEIARAIPYTKLTEELDPRTLDLVGELRSCIARHDWLPCVILLDRAKCCAHYPSELIAQMWEMVMREATRVGHGDLLAQAISANALANANVDTDKGPGRSLGAMIERALPTRNAGYVRRQGADLVSAGVRLEKTFGAGEISLLSYLAWDPKSTTQRRQLLLRYNPYPTRAQPLPSFIDEIDSMMCMEKGSLRDAARSQWFFKPIGSVCAEDEVIDLCFDHIGALIRTILETRIDAGGAVYSDYFARINKLRDDALNGYAVPMAFDGEAPGRIVRFERVGEANNNGDAFPLEEVTQDPPDPEPELEEEMVVAPFVDDPIIEIRQPGDRRTQRYRVSELRHMQSTPYGQTSSSVRLVAQADVVNPEHLEGFSLDGIELTPAPGLQPHITPPGGHEDDDHEEGGDDYDDF